MGRITLPVYRACSYNLRLSGDLGPDLEPNTAGLLAVLDPFFCHFGNWNSKYKTQHLFASLRRKYRFITRHHPTQPPFFQFLPHLLLVLRFGKAIDLRNYEPKRSFLTNTRQDTNRSKKYEHHHHQRDCVAGHAGEILLSLLGGKKTDNKHK